MRSANDAAPAALVACAGGGVGDSLLASVVARALRRRFARVDALTLAEHRSTLERVPDVDDVLVADGGDEASLCSSIASRRYDAAVVTWATARIARTIKRAGIPVRVGQARRLYSNSFTSRVVVRSERGDVTSHWTQVLLDYARALGCDTADAVPRFVPTQGDTEQARSLMQRHGLESERFLILHPTNAIACARAWPTTGWRALYDALRERFGIPVVVTGGARDRDIAASVGAIAVAGETSIGAFGALAALARAYVGITTGAMHVAAAAGAPTVGVFPFQSDFPERWAPLGKRTAVVRASYRCHSGDTKERCADYACIARLDVARIVATTVGLLS